MASLLYIDHMGVPLAHFGWFQGVLAGSYAIVSFLCPKLFNHFKEEKLLTISIYGMLLVTTVMFLVGVILKDNPFVISILIGLFSMLLVFPITILYPRALNLHEKLKGRASALINISILFSTAFGIQMISCFYNGQFLLLGFFIFVLTIIAFITFKKYAHEHPFQNES
jgi:DHA1 family bicyclomycin/chloramphenicol resistance-like MFS transporter